MDWILNIEQSSGINYRRNFVFISATKAAVWASNKWVQRVGSAIQHTAEGWSVGSVQQNHSFNPGLSGSNVLICF